MNSKQTRIENCADILPGYSLKARAEHEPEGSYQVIMAKHVKGCAPYNYTNDDKLRMSPKSKAEKYKVRQGDILFISRGTRNCAAVIESIPENTIASGTFYIVRPHDSVLPAYLAWCLNQPQIQSQISQIRTGAGTPIVQRANFKNIKIPLPSLGKQKQIGELATLMAQELQLRKQLVETTETYQKALGQKLISELCQKNKPQD